MSRYSSTGRSFLDIRTEHEFYDDMGTGKVSRLHVNTLLWDLSLSLPKWKAFRKRPFGSLRYSVDFTWMVQHRHTDSEHIEAEVARQTGKRTYAVYRMDRYGTVEVPTWVLHTPRKREAKRTAKELGLPWDSVETAEQAWLADRY